MQELKLFYTFDRTWFHQEEDRIFRLDATGNLFEDGVKLVFSYTIDKFVMRNSMLYFLSQGKVYSYYSVIELIPCSEEVEKIYIAGYYLCVITYEQKLLLFHQSNWIALEGKRVTSVAHDRNSLYITTEDGALLLLGFAMASGRATKGTYVFHTLEVESKVDTCNIFVKTVVSRSKDTLFLSDNDLLYWIRGLEAPHLMIASPIRKVITKFSFWGYDNRIYYLEDKKMSYEVDFAIRDVVNCKHNVFLSTSGDLYDRLKLVKLGFKVKRLIKVEGSNHQRIVIVDQADGMHYLQRTNDQRALFLRSVE